VNQCKVCFIVYIVQVVEIIINLHGCKLALVYDVFARSRTDIEPLIDSDFMGRLLAKYV